MIIVSPIDVAVRNSSREGLIERSKNFKKLTPEEILEQTPKGKYNEIVALGEIDPADRLKLAGIVTIKDIDGDVGDASIIERLESQAARLDIPVVEVPFYQPNNRRLVREEEELTAQHDGKVYYLKRKGSKRPFTATTGVKSYFASRDEINSVLDYFWNSGEITEEEAAELRVGYQDAYKQVMKPVIASEGQTNYISFRTGVGKDYKEYHHRAGEVSKVTVEGNKRTREEISNEEFIKALEDNKDVMTEEEYVIISEKLI